MTLTEKITEYFRSTREEIRKVSWPTRQDTIRYSALVIAITIAVSAFFALLDYGFSQLVNVAAEKRSEAIVNSQTKANQTDVTPITASTTGAASSSTASPTVDLNALKSSAQTSDGSVQIQAVPTPPVVPSKK